MRRPLALSGCVLLVSGLTFIGCKKDPVVPPPVPVVTPAPEPAPEPEPIPEPVVQMMENFTRVYFELDSDSLSDDAQSALLENVEIMQSNTDIRLQLQGHADERGTTDYNLALGQQRADTVRQYMEMSGVGASRLTVTSMGEEVPIASGSSEQAWSQNRRCEFVITWGGSDSVRSSTE